MGKRDNFLRHYFCSSARPFAGREHKADYNCQRAPFSDHHNNPCKKSVYIFEYAKKNVSS
jgi:hypothetical protein